jgi:hypothetical protein
LVQVQNVSTYLHRNNGTIGCFTYHFPYYPCHHHRHGHLASSFLSRSAGKMCPTCLCCWKSGFDSHTCLGVALRSISSLARPSFRALAAAELAFHVFHPPGGGSCCDAFAPLRIVGGAICLTLAMKLSQLYFCAKVSTRLKTREGWRTAVKTYIFSYTIWILITFKETCFLRKIYIYLIILYKKIYIFRKKLDTINVFRCFLFFFRRFVPSFYA